MCGKIALGSDVLIVLEDGKRRVIKFTGQKVETHKGTISADLLDGSEYGTRVVMNTGKSAYLLEPVVVDYLPKFSRRTQIMYPKEMGYVILKMGIGPGSKVLEGGTGSGGSTSIIANAVGPSGKVVSYDVNPESIKVASANLRRLGLLERVELRLGDVSDVPEISAYDCTLLDLAEPIGSLPKIWGSLKPSGRIAFSSPTYNQLERLASDLHRSGFIHLETVDIWCSDLQLRREAVRPRPLVRGHNTFITLAAKIAQSDD